jgi:hypothetical protein
MRRWLWTTLLALGLGGGLAPTAEAQTYLGQYSWNLAPYCEFFVGQITATGEAYIFSGWDESVCADPPRRNPAYGVFYANLDGTIGGGLTVNFGTFAPMHVGVTLDPSTLSGTWVDDYGGSGEFVRQ